MANHHPFGPSSLPARAVCVCFDSAPGGADAASGTRAHEVVHARIEGTTPPPEATEDELSRGTWGADAIRRIWTEYNGVAPICSELTAKFKPAPETPREVADTLDGLFGTIDAFWITDNALHICDFKTYGTKDDEKSYEPQGRAYAAILNEVRDRVYFHVVNGGDRSVVTYEFTTDAALASTTVLIRRVKAVRSGLFDAPADARAACARPSAWCKYCAYAADCPAIGRAVEVVERNTIMDKPLAVRMAVLPVLESFIKATRAETRAALDEGRRVFDAKTGIEYALATRKGRPKLRDIRGLALALTDNGVDVDKFAASVSMSKTTVEGLLKEAEAAQGVKRKSADRAAIYAPFFTEPGTETYVKRIK